MKKTYKYFLLIILGIVLGICAEKQLNKSKNTITEASLADSVSVKLEQPEFMLYNIPNDSLVFMACKYYGLKHDSIIVTQAKLETGNYQSYQCKVNNNLFGLYNSSKKDYYKFNNWWESVEAYKNMIQYRYKNEENYYLFLSKIGYAEDPDYISKLKFIRNKFLDT